MPILRATEAPQYSLPGATIIGLAALSRVAVEVTTYRVRLDPGSAIPPHRDDHEEVFTVFQGTVTTVFDDEENLVGPGDTVVVPAGTEHYVHSGEAQADIIAAVPTGTIFVSRDESERIADWAR